MNGEQRAAGSRYHGGFLSAERSEPSEFPLLQRFPSLASLPRVALGVFPSPVERLELAGLRGDLWIKRDDLNAPADAYGGNKLRSLEFLLGGVRPGDTVLTIGGHGSTHVLTTTVYAHRLGARMRAIRWPHNMNPMAERVSTRTGEMRVDMGEAGWIGAALLRACIARLRGGVRWVPLGGTSPLGALGHVNAGLELAEQIRAGALPTPARVVVPLGTAGTAAGLALGMAIAGVNAVVVGARVAPRIATNRRRALRIARATARFIERHTGERLPRVPRAGIRVWHGAYAGAYGRPHPRATAAAALLHEKTGIRLDDTYSAKAFAAALELARHRDACTLFWLTFDARWAAPPDLC